MQLKVRQSAGSTVLSVGSQKEFLQLWNSGVIAADDLVERGGNWVRAADLPWIRGMTVSSKRDSRRLIWITLLVMALGLAGVIFIQMHAGSVARRTGALPPESLPPGAVRAVPHR
jgi:hypothetical protein